MSRIFRRGELKEAVVLVLDALGEAHGYAIVAELKDRVGGGWKPSPGAIYPALLALVETGYVRATDRDGTRMYSLTADGRRAASKQRSSARWASGRQGGGGRGARLGRLAPRDFAEGSDLRRRLARTEQRERIEAILRARERRDRTDARGKGRGRRWMSSPRWPLASGRRGGIARRQWFWLHFAVFATTQVFLFVIWTLSDVDFPWFVFPLFGWGCVPSPRTRSTFVKTPEEITIERERAGGDGP